MEKSHDVEVLPGFGWRAVRVGEEFEDCRQESGLSEDGFGESAVCG